MLDEVVDDTSSVDGSNAESEQREGKRGAHVRRLEGGKGSVRSKGKEVEASVGVVWTAKGCNETK